MLAIQLPPLPPVLPAYTSDHLARFVYKDVRVRNQPVNEISQIEVVFTARHTATSPALVRWLPLVAGSSEKLRTYSASKAEDIKKLKEAEARQGADKTRSHLRQRKADKGAE